MEVMPDVNQRIKDIIYHKTGGNIKRFAELINVSQQKLNRLFNIDSRTGKFPDVRRTDIIETILATFKDIDGNWINTGQGEMVLMEGKPLNAHSNLVEKEYKGSTPVKVVTTKARAGWSDAYYSEEYLEDMPTIMIETDENYKGEYLAFEVDNDSMEPEYFAGDVVICRKIKRHLWQYKLHYNDYDFVIAHSKGVTLKEIVDHDVETGVITCHSINQEMGSHPDFKLNLREVAYLFNVVEVRQSGKSKKRRR